MTWNLKFRIIKSLSTCCKNFIVIRWVLNFKNLQLWSYIASLFLLESTQKIYQTEINPWFIYSKKIGLLSLFLRLLERIWQNLIFQDHEGAFLIRKKLPNKYDILIFILHVLTSLKIIPSLTNVLSVLLIILYVLNNIRNLLISLKVEIYRLKKNESFFN